MNEWNEGDDVLGDVKRAKDIIENPEGKDDKREGLSSDCTLDKMVVMAISIEGREHPCDRCNMDRGECRGYPRRDNHIL